MDWIDKIQEYLLGALVGVSTFVVLALPFFLVIIRLWFSSRRYRELAIIREESNAVLGRLLGEINSDIREIKGQHDTKYVKELGATVERLIEDNAVRVIDVATQCQLIDVRVRRLSDALRAIACNNNNASVRDAVTIALRDDIDATVICRQQRHIALLRDALRDACDADVDTLIATIDANANATIDANANANANATGHHAPLGGGRVDGGVDYAA